MSFLASSFRNQDALFDEKHLSDIGSFDDVLHVQRLARLDDTGQVQ
jgi:hypothetical protein